MHIRSFEGASPQLADSAYIAPEAVLIGRVELGAEVSVWPGCVLRGDVCLIRIGGRSNIQDGTIVHGSSASALLPEGSDTIVGEGVTVGHNAILHGCRVGDRALIGMGAIVLDQAVVGAEAMLGAGALVPPGKTLEGGYLWVGAPAKRIRPLSDQERDYLRESAAHYVRLAAGHRESAGEIR